VLRSKTHRCPSTSVSPTLPLGTFTGRVLVILMLAATAFAIWQALNVLLLLFGAVLLAIGLRASARLGSRLTGGREGLALVGVVVLGLVLFAAAGWVFGSVVASQVDEVRAAVPAGLRVVLNRLGSHPYGRQLLDQAQGFDIAGLKLAGATGWATSVVTGTLGAIVRGLGAMAVAVFAAIYLAAQPARYRHLVRRLIPPAHRATADRLFDQVGDILQRWLIGQLVVMATIGVLSGLGLWLLGIEAAAALGLMGGLLCFVPFVGAILAAVPATLVALTQNPEAAVSVVLMYAVVHFVEGNFITPIVQAEATSLPPVLAILSTVAFSVLFGPIGVLLAAPLTLLLMVTLDLLYVQQGLGDEAPA
jgi:predicted PurR-regulated permease PerM